MKSSNAPRTVRIGYLGAAPQISEILADAAFHIIMWKKNIPV
jgi:hypothetical protein